MTSPFIISEDPNVAANTGGMGYGGFGSMFAPPMQDPSFRQYALNNALIDAGMGLVQASAPSRVPQNWGSMFGALAAGAGQGVKSAQEDYYKRQLMAGQVAQQRMQMGMIQQQMKLLNGGMGADPSQTGAPPPQTAATPGNDYYSILGTSESGGDYNTPNAQGSGAQGKYQFMPDTWSATALKHPDLKLPFNMKQATPEQQEAAVRALTADNAKTLQDGGIAPTPANLALAHWVGADGAKKVLAADPKTPVGDILGKDVLAKNPGLNTSAGGLVAGLNQKYAGVQMAQGGAPSADGFPSAPPQITPRQKMMLMSPLLKPLAEAEIANGQKQYEGAKAAYEAKQKLRATAREEANADVLPNGQPNQAKIATDAEKKRVETEAQETARENALFGGKGWQDKNPGDLRKSVNPELLAVTDSVQAGRTPMSNVNQSRAANGISFSKNEVNALGEKLYGEQWDPNGGDRRQKFENDTTDQASQTGKTLYSINTVYKHINRFQELTDALGNKQTPIANEILRVWNNTQGNAKYTTPEALQHALGTEMAAVIKGQQLNEPEVESAIDTIKTTKSPEQMHGALGVLRHAMGDRESTIAWAARRAKVPESRIQGLIDPDARAAINKFDSDQAAFAQAHEQKTAPPPALTGAISLDAINAEIARRQKGAP